jgi:hypothetical protein
MQQMAMFGNPALFEDRPDDDDNPVDSQTGDEDGGDPREGPQDERADDNLPPRDELLDAYAQAKQMIEEKTREADDLRNRLQAMGAETQSLLSKMEQAAFMRELHEAYQKDPVGATAMLVQHSRASMADEMEVRLSQAFRDQRNFHRFMTLFLDDPSNARLKPYRHELETMILDNGMSPSDAAELILTIETQREKSAGKRSAAAREVRNRSAVETGGGASESVDRNRELERVLKKAKTLDEMFAGLRKLKM